MKPTMFFFWSSFILGGAVLGQEARPPRTDINPALLYYQAFLLAPEISKTDRSYLFESQDWTRGQKLPERFGELVGYYGKQLRYARQAAHCTVPCDWGIDMGPGPNTLLPHLSKCKGIVQAGRLRAMWALHEGRPADARDDLIACMALGRKSSRDGTLIGALVQVAIENIVCSTVAENYFQFSPETLKELVEGFAGTPPRGTMAECIKMEKAFFLDWFIANIEKLRKEHPGDEAKVLAAIHELITFMETPEEGETQPAPNKTWEQTLKAAGGTSEGILKLVNDMAALYERLAVVMALPRSEYENRIKEFAGEVESTKNPLVTMAFPAFEKCRTKEFYILAELAMVQAAVEYKLHGEAGLKSVRDPYGDGPFGFQRFYFQGVDRGFELKSAYEGRGYPTSLIFVEKDGPAFQVTGPKAGKAMATASATK